MLFGKLEISVTQGRLMVRHIITVIVSDSDVFDEGSLTIYNKTVIGSGNLRLNRYIVLLNHV